MIFTMRLIKATLKFRSTTFTAQQCCFHTTRINSNSNIQVQEKDGMRKIIMSDMKTRNALSMDMMNQLITEIQKNGSDKTLRTIVITSMDGPVFSAGHNLKELTSDKGIDAQRSIFAKCTELMLSIRKSEVPVIAVVKGLAAAAGCQLIAACDFAIASNNAKFSTPGANFGVFCTTPGISVARSVNRSLAAYMVLTGLPLTAEEARQAGLVTKIYADNKLEEETYNLHSSITSKSRSVIKLGKSFFYKQIELPYEKALREGAEIMVQNLQLEDSQEGLNSFKEKRKPSWTHTDNSRSR